MIHYVLLLAFKNNVLKKKSIGFTKLSQESMTQEKLKNLGSKHLTDSIFEFLTLTWLAIFLPTSPLATILFIACFLPNIQKRSTSFPNPALRANCWRYSWPEEEPEQPWLATPENGFSQLSFTSNRRAWWMTLIYFSFLLPK